MRLSETQRQLEAVMVEYDVGRFKTILKELYSLPGINA